MEPIQAPKRPVHESRSRECSFGPEEVLILGPRRPFSDSLYRHMWPKRFSVIEVADCRPGNGRVSKHWRLVVMLGRTAHPTRGRGERPRKTVPESSLFRSEKLRCRQSGSKRSTECALTLERERRRPNLPLVQGCPWSRCWRYLAPSE